MRWFSSLFFSFYLSTRHSRRCKAGFSHVTFVKRILVTYHDNNKSGSFGIIWIAWSKYVLLALSVSHTRISRNGKLPGVLRHVRYYLVNKENGIILSFLLSATVDSLHHTAIMVIDLNRTRGPPDASTKSTHDLVYLVSDCLHRQPEILPVFLISAVLLMVYRIFCLPLLAKCLRSVKKDPERDARESWQSKDVAKDTIEPEGWKRMEREVAK